MTTNLIEKEIIDSKTERDNLVSRIDVLDKVKELLLLPNMDMATTRQVAEFYGVGKKAIDSIMLRHREELLSDGYKSLKGVEVRELKAHLRDEGSLEEMGLGKFVSLIGLLPRRAILRIGMLLRDSEVAKEVRTQLLNIEQQAPESVKVLHVEEEKALHLAVGEAFASGNMTKFAEASMKLTNYLNRHREQYESIVKNNVTFSAKRIAPRYLYENGDGVSASNINDILVEEGYLLRGIGFSKPTEKGLDVGGSSDSFTNYGRTIEYAVWTETALQKLHPVFRSRGLTYNL